MMCRTFFLGLTLSLLPSLALATEGLDSGDTAWMLVASAAFALFTRSGAWDRWMSVDPVEVGFDG